jgi:hypothetical protein
LDQPPLPVDHCHLQLPLQAAAVVVVVDVLLE